MFVSLQVNGIKVSKARVLEARKGTKPIVGRDWLTALRYKIVHATEEGDTAKATQTPREKILTRLKDSMLKVENVKERKVQASDEKQDKRQPIKLKHGRVKNNATEISEQESKVNFSTSDFEEEIDSTILVRERTRGSKLEPAFTKKRGRILDHNTFFKIPIHFHKDFNTNPTSFQTAMFFMLRFHSNIFNSSRKKRVAQDLNNDNNCYITLDQKTQAKLPKLQFCYFQVMYHVHSSPQTKMDPLKFENFDC